MRFLTTIGLLCAALFSSPAVAQEACTYTFDDVLKNQIVAGGHPATVVPTESIPEMLEGLSDMTGDEYDGVTRAFVANVSGTILLGLEVGGCLLPPIVIATTPEPASNTRSGRIGDRTYA